MDDYIRYGWCKEVNQQPAFQDAAMEALHLMGVDLPESATGDAICEKMTETACKLVQGKCEGSGNIMVACGNQTTCQPIETLKERMESSEHKQYAAKFSTTEKRKIALLNALMKDKVSPCTMFSDNNEMCTNQGVRCMYHVNLLWNNQWDPEAEAVLQSSCFIKEHYIAELLKNPEQYEEDDFRAAAFDVLMQQSHLLQAFTMTGDKKHPTVSSIFDGSLKGVDWITYRVTIYEAIQDADFSHLQAILQNTYLINNPPTVQKSNSDFMRERFLALGETIVQILANVSGSTVVKATEVMGLVKNMGVNIDETKARSMAYLINTASVSNVLYFLPWSYYLLNAYLGYSFMYQLAVDPLCYGMYMFLLWYSGVPSDFAFGPVAKQFSAVLSVVPPTRVVEKVNQSLEVYDLNTFDKMNIERLRSIKKGQLPWNMIGGVFAYAVFLWQERGLLLTRWKYIHESGSSRLPQVRDDGTNQYLGALLTSYWWKLRNLGVNDGTIMVVQHVAQILSTP